MPNAVCALLTDAGVRDLGIHTEMLVDGMIDLCRGRASSPARARRSTRYQIVFTFAAGSRRQYDFIDRNPRVAGAPGRLHQPAAEHHAERPRRLDQQHDARSTCRARRRRSRPATATSRGTGGQLQFVRGAYASRGGKSFMCLSSTYEKGGRAAEPHRRRRSRPATSSPRRAPTSCTSSPSTAS